MGPLISCLIFARRGILVRPFQPCSQILQRLLPACSDNRERHRQRKRPGCWFLYNHAAKAPSICISEVFPDLTFLIFTFSNFCSPTNSTTWLSQIIFIFPAPSKSKTFFCIAAEALNSLLR